MNLSDAKMILISQLEGYLNGKISLKVMRDFSWNMIEYFSKCKKTELPAPQDFEKELWYAIWEIQHLADEAHEEEDVTRKTLTEALEYLKKTKKIPESYEGIRP